MYNRIGHIHMLTPGCSLPLSSQKHHPLITSVEHSNIRTKKKNTLAVTLMEKMLSHFLVSVVGNVPDHLRRWLVKWLLVAISLTNMHVDNRGWVEVFQSVEIQK